MSETSSADAASDNVGQTAPKAEKFDPAAVLGVAEGASGDDLKKAHRRLAAQTHPDRNDGDGSRYQDVDLAYRAMKGDPAAVKEVWMRNGGRAARSRQAADAYVNTGNRGTQQPPPPEQGSRDRQRNTGRSYEPPPRSSSRNDRSQNPPPRSYRRSGTSAGNERTYATRTGQGSRFVDSENWSMPADQGFSFTESEFRGIRDRISRSAADLPDPSIASPSQRRTAAIEKTQIRSQAARLPGNQQVAGFANAVVDIVDRGFELQGNNPRRPDGRHVLASRPPNAAGMRRELEQALAADPTLLAHLQPSGGGSPEYRKALATALADAAVAHSADRTNHSGAEWAVSSRAQQSAQALGDMVHAYTLGTPTQTRGTSRASAGRGI